MYADYKFYGGPPGCNGTAPYKSDNRALSAARTTLRNRRRGPNDMLAVSKIENGVEKFVGRIVHDGGGESLIIVD